MPLPEEGVENTCCRMLCVWSVASMLAKMPDALLVYHGGRGACTTDVRRAPATAQSDHRAAGPPARSTQLRKTSGCVAARIPDRR